VGGVYLLGVVVFWFWVPFGVRQRFPFGCWFVSCLPWLSAGSFLVVVFSVAPCRFCFVLWRVVIGLAFFFDCYRLFSLLLAFLGLSAAFLGCVLSSKRVSGVRRSGGLVG
jgi:hypothetical protein